MIRSLILSVAFACLFVLIPEKASAKPSFDCSKATAAIEKAICDDPALAEADHRMAQMYALAQTSAFGKGKSSQLSAQREWMKSRNDCSTPASDNGKTVECLAGMYRDRNAALAVALLLDNPDIALPSLRKDVPQLASLYEALQLYMTSDPKKRDRAVALLSPYFAKMAADPEKNFGYSVLTGIAASAEEAVTSDYKLGATLSIMSIYIDEEGDRAESRFPCAALVRRPEMMSAIKPYFGSTLDNFLMSSNCDDTLPAQPRLIALRNALNGYWKDDCGGGTIRFAVYRGFAAQVIAAQIGQPVGDSRVAPLQRKGLKPQLVTAAFAELSDQYQRYRGMDKAEAEQRARAWLGVLIQDAGKCYDE
jgi:hypothetical protein